MGLAQRNQTIEIGGAACDQIASAFVIGRWETIGEQARTALSPELIGANDVIIVLGNDLSDAPWTEGPDATRASPGS